MSNSELREPTLRDSEGGILAGSREAEAPRDPFEVEFVKPFARAKFVRHRVEHAAAGEFVPVDRQDKCKTQRSRKLAISKRVRNEVMYDGAETSMLTGSAERLYFELMYCRGDARALALPEVEQLLDLACEAMRKLASGDPRHMPSAAEWTALEVYPAMK